MSTPVSTSPPREVNLSSIALWVLVVAALGSAPALLSVPVWMLHQPWITIPALLIVAVARWRPKALLAVGLLARQHFVQRNAKTKTA